ncbi:regulator of chromosome condensation (RCC1) repeat-containing protein [Toxoplasma gondii ME49]|uniref:Regulator of chromosome condensation (RCC1) repeat-containing protein n=4 Tax=Toxoplasma gondii TaxID=5811 RepID=A0A086JHS6_TOXGO|nr:regulator of chromosome condensation (RCC1) repeat-containing protein [Toxoplasma gondii ME49]EPT26672.1 regulator of chromosome condensation (RCC1) repeat-containing protein [Toxoplasma gondii ME49]KFG31694.1 regulator of chromosome condensation (RCC1) repeat-containing protein [Toxoplasma gondii GAB2-2007-GAL-DOM2]KYF43086.1 regulator of chromosome condensation (RCC1) repeat-containing protein [Toxoplasma gondii ARI]|eukprot:XP_002369008.1 regulator of chromosome condensation (RCC1) repeat-containing protein [Toxoplasma gondii ME49]
MCVPNLLPSFSRFLETLVVTKGPGRTECQGKTWQVFSLFATACASTDTRKVASHSRQKRKKAETDKGVFLLPFLSSCASLKAEAAAATWSPVYVQPEPALWQSWRSTPDGRVAHSELQFEKQTAMWSFSLSRPLLSSGGLRSHLAERRQQSTQFLDSAAASPALSPLLCSCEYSRLYPPSLKSRGFHSERLLPSASHSECRVGFHVSRFRFQGSTSTRSISSAARTAAQHLPASSSSCVFTHAFSPSQPPFLRSQGTRFLPDPTLTFALPQLVGSAFCSLRSSSVCRPPSLSSPFSSLCQLSLPFLSRAVARSVVSSSSSIASPSSSFSSSSLSAASSPPRPPSSRSSSWSLWYVSLSANSSATPQELLRLPPSPASSPSLSPSSSAPSSSVQDEQREPVRGEGREEQSNGDSRGSSRSFAALPITSLSVGRTHGACVIDGKVFAFGRSNAKGQLGSALASSALRPSGGSSFSPIVSLLAPLASFFSFASAPAFELMQVDPPEGGWKGKVVKVACGATHACALTDLGCMYTWGAPSGLFQGSPLGVGDCRRRVRPTLVSSFVRAREHVEDVACGPSWTLCTTRSNRVYAAGSSDFGVTGRGATGSSSVFQEVEFFHSVLLPSSPSFAATSAFSPAFSSPGVRTPGGPSRAAAPAGAEQGISAGDSQLFSPSLESLGALQGLTAAEMQAQLRGQLPVHFREKLRERRSLDEEPAARNSSSFPASRSFLCGLPNSEAATRSCPAEHPPLPGRRQTPRDVCGVRTPEPGRAGDATGSFRAQRRETGCREGGAVLECGGTERVAGVSARGEPGDRAERALRRTGLVPSPDAASRASGESPGVAGTREGQKGGNDGETDSFHHGEMHSRKQTKVRHIACGSRHSLLATDDGRLWAWGRNEEGQLGREVEATAMTGASISFSPYPVLVHSLLRGGARVSQVAGSSTQSFALSEDGSLHAWGGSWGRKPVAMTLHPRFEQSAIKGNVTKLAAGWEEREDEDCVLAVTDSGDLYVWGASLAASFRAAASAAVASMPGARPEKESTHAESETREGARDKEPVKIDRTKLFGGGAVRDVACGPLGVLVLVEH